MWNYENSSVFVEIYSDQPYNATNISMYSFSNAGVLNGTIQLYEWAAFGEKLGDAVFLNLSMQYNGQANNDLDLIKLANNNATLLNVWAESSSDEDLSELYRSLYKRIEDTD